MTTTTIIPIGTKLNLGTIARPRMGVVEQHLERGGKLWRYYVRWLNADGKPSKIGTRCHPQNAINALNGEYLDS